MRSLLRPLVPRAARQYPLASAFQVREEVSPTTAPASSAGAASAGAATTGPREAAARADPAYGRSGFEVDLGPTSGGFAPGMAPPPGAGSLVGPDHPLFHGRGGPPGPGWDGLPPGVPPGARFDPFGPGVPGPGVPGPGRGLPRGPRGPRGPRAPGFGCVAPHPDVPGARPASHPGRARAVPTPTTCAHRGQATTTRSVAALSCRRTHSANFLERAGPTVSLYTRGLAPPSPGAANVAVTPSSSVTHHCRPSTSMPYSRSR